jgi:tetratricopeptide (TPR) repeat protein
VSPRVRAYGLAGAVVLVLLGAGFVAPRLVRPDVETLVRGAELQLRGFGLHAEALRDVRRALDRDPDHPKAHLLGAEACEGLGAWSEALTFLERAEGLHADRPALLREIRVRRLRALVRLGRGAEVEELAEALLTARPCGVVHYLRGESREARDRLGAALLDHRESVTLGGPVEADLAVARILDRLGRDEEAILALEAGVAKDPSRVSSWLELARRRLDRGDHGRAAEALLEGAKANPRRIREALRQDSRWVPLRRVAALAPLLGPAAPRAPE